MCRVKEIAERHGYGGVITEMEAEGINWSQPQRINEAADILLRDYVEKLFQAEEQVSADKSAIYSLVTVWNEYPAVSRKLLDYKWIEYVLTDKQ